jgi:hypothetical protein
MYKLGIKICLALKSGLAIKPIEIVESSKRSCNNEKDIFL